MDNNDISLFEKVVFVNNIPSEMDAMELSRRYPFAIFVSDYGNFGSIVNGELNSDVPENTRDWNQYAFNNLWKNGKRLTKFNNVDPKNHSVNMDTYTINLDFDLAKGLLSLNAVAKVDSYNVVGFIYKTGNETYNTFINQTEMRGMIPYLNSGAMSKSITNISGVEWENEIETTNQDENLNFGTFDKYVFESTLYNINKIDAADNKFYMIVSYEAEKADALYSVPANAYSIYCNNTEFSVTASPMFASEKLNQIININNNTKKTNLINKILKYTDNIVYVKGEDPVNQRCVIYEITVNENIEPDDPHDKTKVSFSFESLKNLPPIDLQVTYAYINPISFNLSAMIDNEWVTIDPDSNKDIYFMPDEASQFNMEIFPSNVRKLKLDVTLTARDGAAMKYLIGETNGVSASRFNFDTSVANAETTNMISFTLDVPSEFSLNKSERAYMGIKLSNWDPINGNGAVRYQKQLMKLSQYIFRRLDLPANVWSYAGISTSGAHIDYMLPNVDALFFDDNNSVMKRKTILEDDAEFKINLVVRPHNNTILETSTVSGKLLIGNVNNNIVTVSQADLNNSAKRLSINHQETITIPWIKDTAINGNQTNDWIFARYEYKGYLDSDENGNSSGGSTHKKYFKNDILTNIIINYTNGNQSTQGIRFTKATYGGSEDSYIEKISGAPIIFQYANGQEIDGYFWYFNSSMTTLKDYLTVYSTIKDLQNSPIKYITTSIVGGQIKCASLNDTDNYRSEYAYIQVGSVKSDLIECNVQRLMIDWWIYVGQLINNAPAVAFDGVGHNAFTLNNSDARTKTSGDITLRHALHYGGWIHLGTKDLSQLSAGTFKKYNPVTNAYENMSRTNIIWDSISGITIDAGANVDVGDQYVVIIPNELEIQDGIGVTGDPVGEMTNVSLGDINRWGDNDPKRSQYRGTYTAYQFMAGDNLGFGYAIVHK